MVADSEARNAMASSIEMSIEGAVASGATLNRAAVDFSRVAANELRADEAWLPPADAIGRLGADGTDQALRILAFGMIEDWRAVHRVWSYQSRLYRYLAYEEAEIPERRLASACAYRPGHESPNPLRPDIVLIALGTPTRPGGAIGREALLDLNAAHRIAAMDVRHLAEHGLSDSAASAVELAADMFLHLAEDAEVGAATLTVESFSATPEVPEELASVRRDMAAIGSAMISMRMEDDSDTGQLVRAFGQRMATGHGAMPDVPVDLIPSIAEAVFEAASGAWPLGDSAPHPATVASIASHLRRVAVETDTEVPGDRLAAPFPDRHVTALTSSLARRGTEAHASGVRAIEIGADFVVAGLTGFAERCPTDPELADTYLCAARAVARASRSARQELLWADNP